MKTLQWSLFWIVAVRNIHGTWLLNHVQQRLVARTVLSLSLLSGKPSAAFSELAGPDSLIENEQSKLTVQSFTNGLISGSLTRISKELILHPIDTVKTRVQVQKNKFNNSSSLHGNILFEPEVYQNLYAGIVPSVLGGVPAGAIFFGTKDFVKALCKDVLTTHGYSIFHLSDTLVQQTSTVVAVVAANVLYWLVRNPFEVLKTQAQVKRQPRTQTESLPLTHMGTAAMEAGETQQTDKNEMTSEKQAFLLRLVKAYGGGSYTANLLYALPADILKFLAYEALQGWTAGIGTTTAAGPGLEMGSVAVQGAVLGALASVIAQLLTTPLDMARTRRMTATSVMNPHSPSGERVSQPATLLGELKEAYNQEGLIRGLFAGTTPRVVRAIVSGAVQFATYEVSQRFLLLSQQ